MPSRTRPAVAPVSEDWRPLARGQAVTWRYRRGAPLHRGVIVCFVRGGQSARAAMCEAAARAASWPVQDLEARVSHALRAVPDVVAIDRYIVDFDGGVAYLPVPATTIELQNAHVREEVR